MYRRKLDQAEPGEPRDGAEHDEDEERARQVDAGHQLAERDQGAEPVAADGERHRAERAHRRQPHDDAHHLEQRVARSAR